MIALPASSAGGDTVSRRIGADRCPDVLGGHVHDGRRGAAKVRRRRPEPGARGCLRGRLFLGSPGARRPTDRPATVLGLSMFRTSAAARTSFRSTDRSSTPTAACCCLALPARKTSPPRPGLHVRGRKRQRNAPQRRLGIQRRVVSRRQHNLPRLPRHGRRRADEIQGRKW